ncbi:MAG: ABC transporter permease [Armatimonadetes bacterium]|nr:ABC transporter permease [Armatimonadota bacterium]
MAALRDIWLLYRRELRSAFRESNIVLYSLLVPLLLYPFLIWLLMSGLSFITGQIEATVGRVVLVDPPSTHPQLPSLLEEEKGLELVESADPQADLVSGRVELLVRFQPDSGGSGPEDFDTELVYDGSREISRAALERVREFLARYREHYAERRAREQGVKLEDLQLFWIEKENVSSAQDLGRFILGLLLPFTLMVILVNGGLYPAIDSTAGERERGTWETLMLTATSRTHVVIAKYLYVATMATVAGLLNLAAMLVSMRSIVAPLSRDLAGTLDFSLQPQSLLVILLGAVLLALMLSAGMMVLASFARSFREGQSFVTPLFMFAVLPVAVISDPALEFTPLLACVPVINVALMWREAINGNFPSLLIAVTVAVQAVGIALAVRFAAFVMSYEDMLLGSYGGSLWTFLKERVFSGRRRDV